MAEENINLVEPDILDGVSAAEVKTVIDKIAAGAITNFEVSDTIILHVLMTLIPVEWSDSEDQG